jgi:hypothetical protein
MKIFSGKCDNDIFADSLFWPGKSMCYDIRISSITVAGPSSFWTTGCFRKLGNRIDLSTPKSSFKRHAWKGL